MGAMTAIIARLTARAPGTSNAEAIMSLEALEQSGAWQSYWDSRLAPTA